MIEIQETIYISEGKCLLYQESRDSNNISDAPGIINNESVGSSEIDKYILGETNNA